MNPLETLQILIEADYHGLESSLRQGMSKIEQFISSANDQSINWTSILQGSFTPALIATIAATFALSIEQALQFQNSLQSASLSTKDSFATNAATMTNSLYSLSSQTGQSATDIASAMGIVGQVFKNTATAEGILGVVSQEAFIRHQNVVDVAKQLVPLFQQWGVTSIPQASDAMAVLNDSVKNGSITFDDLVSGLTGAGVALKKYTDLSSAAAQTELASVSPGMDTKSALQGLAATASAIENPLGQSAILLGNMAKIVTSGGMAGAFEDIAKKIQGAGIVANQLYGAIGFDQTSIQHFKDASIPALSEIAAAAVLLIQKHEALGQQVKENTTATDKFKEAWASVVAESQKFIVPAGLAFMSDFMKGLNTDLKFFDTFLSALSTNAAKDIQGVVGFFSKLLGGGSGSSNATATTPVNNNTTTYQIQNVNVGSNGQTLPKLGSILPGVPAGASSKAQ